MCQINNDTKSIQHYHNPANDKNPILLDAGNPSIGFTSLKFSTSDGLVIFSVTRNSSLLHIDNYFNVSNVCLIMSMLPKDF